MRKTIKQLEEQLEYAKKFEDMYRDEKNKYEEQFGKEYEFLLRNERKLYESQEHLVEIIRWLVNPETAVRFSNKERP